MHENAVSLPEDPLWKLRHALAGVALALLASVFLAAFAARWLGDWVADRYAVRAGIYGALLLYVVVGAGVLFAKVARHEVRPLSLRRVLLWLADRKSTRLNSSHEWISRMPSSA